MSEKSVPTEKAEVSDLEEEIQWNSRRVNKVIEVLLKLSDQDKEDPIVVLELLNA